MRFTYSGDVNPEHGGVLLNVSNWRTNGYADAVRITPCSDAGGPDNIWWVEAVTVLKTADLAKAREAHGWCKHCATTATDEVQAALAYGCYEPMDCYSDYSRETVQIGSDDPFYNGREQIEPTMRLRADASILRYARRFAKERIG